MQTDPAAYISLGGNLGREKERFADALALLDSMPGIRVRACSGIYITEPQGVREQPWFHNQAASLDCFSLGPKELLRELHRIENVFGRTRDARTSRFGPRVLDLDLLLFTDTVWTEEGCIVPHPRMAERAFVLLPLLELTPALRMPDGRRLSDILTTLPYRLQGNCILQESGMCAAMF
jgi:2-amino-4-hydroxy-6-hydroxymethyldihydropteridine diphosphokinase